MKNLNAKNQLEHIKRLEKEMQTAVEIYRV